MTNILQIVKNSLLRITTCTIIICRMSEHKIKTHLWGKKYEETKNAKKIYENSGRDKNWRTQ